MNTPTPSGYYFCLCAQCGTTLLVAEQAPLPDRAAGEVVAMDEAGTFVCPECGTRQSVDGVGLSAN